MGRGLDFISKLDARHRITIGVAAAALMFFALRRHVLISTDAIASWDTFAFVVLVLAWLVIVRTPQAKIRARATAQDVGRRLISLFVVVAASVALFAVGFLLGANRNMPQPHLTAHLIL